MLKKPTSQFLLFWIFTFMFGRIRTRKLNIFGFPDGLYFVKKSYSQENQKKREDRLLLLMSGKKDDSCQVIDHFYGASIQRFTQTSHCTMLI